MSDQAETFDYKPTVFLPKTDFPMRAGLPKKEPGIVDWWQEIDLYGRLRRQSKGREKYILHDGPPYANGHLHIGHALNKILKDIVTRSQQMLGKDSNYVPGWDCHGLPIEWKIEEQYRAKGQDKDEVPVLDFRQECREFAEHWVAVQSQEFQRLGVIGDWQAPYLTMSHEAEGQIAREIHKFVLNGGLYKGLKPVLWSVVEKTALADAEVEYREHTSTTVHVRFPVIAAGRPSLEDAAVVAWTTTPWTLPANRALAYGKDITYAVYEIDSTEDGAQLNVGDRLVVAADLADSLAEAIKVVGWREIDRFEGAALAGTACAHPLRGQGYEFDVPMLAGDFVTTEQGTGIVHIAPSHGQDDYLLGLEHGLKAEETVAEDGRYTAAVPLFAGLEVYTQEGKPGPANKAVTTAIDEAGNLLAQGKLRHDYPHSWRSKAPLLFRATAQWFISMETNDLRAKALDSLKNTAFFPQRGYNRLSSMIETRPDWCVSRQRAWGVPIAIFVHRETGELLRDETVLNRIAEIFEQEGSDAWFARDPQDFLGNNHSAEDWQPVTDIVEVWFESGSTHAFVLEKRDDLHWPASLYLEGSDQHRGWFHSSLLESCGTRGRAPYDAVLTHGFILDEKGNKMSKSEGNQVSPAEVQEQYGADILRLWVVGVDYSQDLRIGPEILKQQADSYRRIRNTLRYLLGALSDFDAGERVAAAEMPELERWVLHRLVELDRHVRAAIEGYDFHELFHALHQFCNEELSAFYFDIRKDSLYCDRPEDPRRRAARTVMDQVYQCLVTWLAPVLCFTTEEAWQARHGTERGSVHEQLYPDIPEAWRDAALGEKWANVRRIRRVVTGALERERAEKRIGAFLQAHPTVYVSADLAPALEGVDLAEVAIASDVTVEIGEGPSDGFRIDEVPGVAVVPGFAEGEKCQRCWKVLPEVGTHHGLPGVCTRCADAVISLQQAAE